MSKHRSDTPLLPCPFCGNADIYKDITSVEGYGDFTDYDLAIIECPNCGAKMQDPNSPYSHNIENAWNKRPGTSTKLTLHNRRHNARHK